MKQTVLPTKAQIGTALEVTHWYLTTHYGTEDEPGMPGMFCDRARIGELAIEREALKQGTPDALFALLVTTAMFQRLQDRIVMGILRGIDQGSARELVSMPRLLQLADACPCPHVQSTESLRLHCDLTKDATLGVGSCEANPATPCHLKRHTVTLRRYGHFGKMPTSVALALREQGAESLPALRERIFRAVQAPHERARALEAALSRSWRVSQKIASMFLSAIANPDIALDGQALWQDGVDWSHFVVIDTNVDLFLTAVGYRGTMTYDARRSFIAALARPIDLSTLRPGLQPYNPRIVQQALYLFMSSANRKPLGNDCAHRGASACAGCPSRVRSICPVRPSAL